MVFTANETTDKNTKWRERDGMRQRQTKSKMNFLKERMRRKEKKTETLNREIIKITLQRCKLMAIITIINERINNKGTRREQFLSLFNAHFNRDVDHNVVIYAV